MAFVVTLRDYVPTPRYDGEAWRWAIIEESAASVGPWTQRAQLDLAQAQWGGIDTDPTNPKTRNFTIDNATLQSGWYRVVFADAAVDELLPTDPVQNVVEVTLSWTPTLEDVGSILRSRTKDAQGNELGTFSSETRPTASQVNRIIRDVVSHLATRFGNTLTADQQEAAQHVAKLGAAMMIEISFYPEQIQSGRSPYEHLRLLYRDARTELEQALEDIGVDVMGTGVGHPEWSSWGESTPAGLYAW